MVLHVRLSWNDGGLAKSTRVAKGTESMRNQQRAFGRWLLLAALGVLFVVMGVFAGGNTSPRWQRIHRGRRSYDKHAPVDPVAQWRSFRRLAEAGCVLCSPASRTVISAVRLRGLENQKGGMKRTTFIKQLKDKGWNLLPLDLGGQPSDMVSGRAEIRLCQLAKQWK
jgi:hypothetical protein